MLNKVVLMGRLTAQPELKTTGSGVSVLSFSIAVERNFKPQGGERVSDFINCVAWRQTADFISKYFVKGQLIAVEGTLQTRSYDDKTGAKRFVTEVVVDQTYFTGDNRNRPEGGGGGYQGYQQPSGGGYQQGGGGQSFGGNSYAPAPPTAEPPAYGESFSVGSDSDFDKGAAPSVGMEDIDLPF